MPEPESKTASFGLRLPDWLRRDLADRALAERRSLNSEIVHRLTASLTASRDSAGRLLDALELPKVVRLRSSSTTADVERLATVCRELSVDRILLGARADTLNGAVMVVIAGASHLNFSCVMDSTSINLARDPRISEVASLFQHFDALGLLDGGRWCRNLLPDTQHLSPDEAATVIAREGETRELGVSDYLRLLANGSPIDERRFRARAP